MKNFMLVAISGGMLFLGGLAVGRLERPMRVKAQNGCSVGSIQGTYFSQYSGFVSPSPGAPATAPFAGIQRSVADGNGNLAGSNSFSINGVPFRTTFSGTYTVNPDCTGSETAKDNLGNVSTNDFLVGNGGTQIFSSFTQAGITTSAIGWQQ